MRLTDGYRCTDSIKERNYLVPRKHRIEKIRDEELGEELEEAMYKKKPNLRRKVHSTKLYRQLC